MKIVLRIIIGVFAFMVGIVILAMCTTPAHVENYVEYVEHEPEAELSTMISDERLPHVGILDLARPIEIEITRYERGRIYITAYYADILLGLQSQEITGAIVQIVHGWLVEQSRDPVAEWIFISVHGFYRVEGGVMTWGNSTNEFTTGRAVWHPN